MTLDEIMLVIVGVITFAAAIFAFDHSGWSKYFSP